jgi:hypothetical protein
MMFAVPAATAVTVPDALTVATLVLLELQVIARPVRTAPEASRVTADAVVVVPTYKEASAIDTETVATGTFETVTAAWPVMPSLVAMTFAVPAATAVTVPDALTVATPVLLELQTTGRPLRTLLAASRGTAAAAVC